MNKRIISELKSIKSEIENFSKDFIPDCEEDIKNSIKNLLKDIFLIKYLSEVSDNFHLNSMLSDYMFLIKSFQENNYRYINLNLRSIIEHNLRLFLEEDTSGDKRTNDLLRKTEEELKKLDNHNICMEKIIDSYKRACNYVHGNAKADMPVIKYYQETTSMSYNEKRHRSLLGQIIGVTKELFKLLLIKNYELIDYAFHRKKTILKYLTNESYVDNLREIAN